MKDMEKDRLLQKRVVRAVDTALSSLDPSAFDQQRILNKMTEDKPMKKKLSVGLAVAIALLLLTVTAIAAVLLTPQQVVEQVAVPLAQNNDSDWRVNTDFSPEELAAFIRACAENGIDLDENNRIIQALQNGEGYDEEEAIMEVCRIAFGGTIDQWTIEQRNWFYGVLEQIGWITDVQYEDAPGPDDLTEEEAKAILLAAIRAECGEDLPLEDQEQYSVYIGYIAPGENDQNDAAWYLTINPRNNATVMAMFSAELDKEGNVLEVNKTDVSAYVPPVDAREFRLTQEEAAQLAADAIRTETGVDAPLMDSEKYHYNIYKSAEDMTWSVTFVSHTMDFGVCRTTVNDETGEVTILAADVGGLTADNILGRYRNEYGWYGDWPQDRWVELSEKIHELPPAETVDGMALQATMYIPWREGLLIREQAEEIAFRAINIRRGEFNCGALIDAEPNPVWKFRVLPWERYDGTYVMEIDAVTGEIVDQDMYISDHMDLEPAYHMYTLHRTWARIVLEHGFDAWAETVGAAWGSLVSGEAFDAFAETVSAEADGRLYLAGLAVLHAFADLTYDMPEADSVPIWDGDYYRAEEDGNTVVFHSQWSDLPDYKVVLDENGVPAEVSEQPSSGETPLPDYLPIGGNG